MTKQELLDIINQEIYDREVTCYEVPQEEIDGLKIIKKTIEQGYALEHDHIFWLVDLVEQHIKG